MAKKTHLQYLQDFNPAFHTHATPKKRALKTLLQINSKEISFFCSRMEQLSAIQRRKRKEGTEKLLQPLEHRTCPFVTSTMVCVQLSPSRQQF